MIDEQVRIKKEFFNYLHYWKFFLFSFFFFLIVTFIYIKRSNPIYKIETKVKILDEKKGVNIPVNTIDLLSKTSVNLDNEIEVFKSKRLIESVISDLNLNTSYFYENNFKKAELWNVPINVKLINDSIDRLDKLSFEVQILKNGYKFFFNDSLFEIKGRNVITKIGGKKIFIEPNFHYKKNTKINKLLIEIKSLEYTQNILIEKLKVEPISKEGDILSLSIEDQNVEKSKVILNKIVKAFNNDGVNDKQLMSKKTIEFIDDRFKYITYELDSIENYKKNFKQSNYLSFLESDASLNINNRANSENLVFEAETQIELSNLLKKELNNNNIFALLPSNIGLNNESINSLVRDYNNSILIRDKSLKTAGKDNPIIKTFDSEILNLRDNLNQSILTYLKQLKINLDQQKSNTVKLDELVYEIPLNEKTLRSIERQQKIKEDLYLMLLQRREEASISYAVTSPSLKIIDYAGVGLFPVFPKTGLLYFISFLLSIFTPFSLIYLSSILNTKIKSVSDLIKTNIPVVGEIPFFNDNFIFKDKNDRSISAEVFRIIYTNIKFLLSVSNNDSGKVILVTSSIMGEGKTFVASNLSLVLSSYDKKVLLIGADLRKPKLSQYLNVSFNGNGLSTYLRDEKTSWIDFLVKNSCSRNHDILFSGFIPPNPSHLLSNGRFEALIEEAKLIYDYIVIDSAPVIYVNDTFLISKLADLTIYVTRYNYTERELVDFSSKNSLESKLNNMTYLLNGIKHNKGVGYNHYGYAYGIKEKNSKKRNFMYYSLKIKKVFIKSLNRFKKVK
jgi:capsular exopolysaccharide synthesis family protein